MLPDEQNYVSYSCNGSQTEFPITFSWNDEDTIKVYILNINTLDESELNNPDDFSVAENNVITKKAWSSDYKLFIYRILPIEQPIDFKTAGKISLEVIEKILDDYGRVLQQFRDMIARTPLLSPTSSIRNLAMEDPVEAFWLIYMSNKFRAREHFGPSDYVIEAFMKLFLESMNAAEARGHIGAVSSVSELSDTEITGPADLDLIQQSGGKWKDRSPTEIFGALGDSNPWRHDRYVDAESVSAMGAKGDSNPLHHDKMTDHTKLSNIGTNTHAQIDTHIAAPPLSSYDTGWVACDEWRNRHLGDTVDGNVNHALGANLSQLLVKVIISTDGTDGNSFEILTVFRQYTGSTAKLTGLVVYQVDTNNVKVQTGVDGISTLNDDGGILHIDIEAWYYKIVVYKLG